METRAPFIVIGGFVLAAIVAVFGFVYWLNNAGAIGRRASYNLAFDGPVPGLLTGAPVLFNGIRVGEVTSLRLDPNHPRAVAATIAVATDIPLRKDTRLGLDFQGLTGVPVIALEGGTGSEPLGPDDTLQAEKGAGQSMTQAARDALQRVDTVLSENADALHGTIANVSTFAEALARNTPRLDNILAGLERMTGTGPAVPSKTVYDILPAEQFDSPRPALKTQLTIAEPSSVARLQTQRFLFSAGEEPPAFAQVQWSDSLPLLIQAKLLQSFENYDSNHPPLRPDSGVQPAYRLLIDLRQFEIEQTPTPVATIALSVKLLDASNQVAAARIFRASSPLRTLEPAVAAGAFTTAFQELAQGIVLWTAANSKAPGR